MLRQVRKHLVLSVPCLQVGKWTRKSMHLHRQHFQGASESEEATRDLSILLSLRHPLPLPRSSDCKTATMQILLIQILASKEHEVTLKVRETLER